MLVVHAQTQLARNRDHAAATAAASHLGNVLCANRLIDFVQPDAGVRPARGVAWTISRWCSHEGETCCARRVRAVRVGTGRVHGSTGGLRGSPD